MKYFDYKMKVAHLQGYCSVCSTMQSKTMPLEMYEDPDRPSIKCPTCKTAISMKIEKITEEN